MMNRSAYIQVLGAISYGELQAYEGSRAKASTMVDDDERRAWKKVAAEELRHFKGFTRRLRELGVDPEIAMEPFRRPLDTFNANRPANEVEDAVWSFLGEGLADDLMLWLREVVDADTAAFVDTVIEDEAEHEARAAAELRHVLERDPSHKELARKGARRMIRNLAFSSRGAGAPVGDFLRLGKPHELVRHLVGGYVRRLRLIGIEPWHLLPQPTDLLPRPFAARAA